MVYLIVVLAHRLRYKFDKYYLHVNGSYSRISIYNDKNSRCELHMPTSESSFNKGLVMLLDCLHQFTVHLEPYSNLLGRSVMVTVIEGDKINQSSIKYSSESMEQWTRACKCMLYQLQQLCLVSQFKDKEDQKTQHTNDPVLASLATMK